MRLEGLAEQGHVHGAALAVNGPLLSALPPHVGTASQLASSRLVHLPPGSGIGKHTAALLAQQGATVLVHGESVDTCGRWRWQ